MPNFFRDSNGALNLAAQKLVLNQGFRAGHPLVVKLMQPSA